MKEKYVPRTLPRGRIAQWSREQIAALCAQVLGGRPRGLAAPRAPAKKKRSDGRRLVSRSLAFGMTGVSLANRFWSRGGVRGTDGGVVMALWAEDIRRAEGACSYLLWAPNVGGARPWTQDA